MLFLRPNPNCKSVTCGVLSQVHYFHTECVHLPHSELHVQPLYHLFLAERWTEHKSHVVRRCPEGTRIKRWPARSAPTSTGDSIHGRNTTEKYCWQLLEAPQWFQLTQEMAIVLLSPLPCGWAMPSPPWPWFSQGELVLGTGLTEKLFCKTEKVIGFHLGSSTAGEWLGTCRLSFHSCPLPLWDHRLSYRCY